MNQELLNQELLEALSEEDPDNQKIIKLLQEGANPNYVSIKDHPHKLYTQGDTPLLVAAQHCPSAQIFEALLKNGADITYINKKTHTTFLHMLVWNKNSGLVKHFIQFPEVVKTINYPNRRGNTALHLNANSGNEEITTILLNNRANPALQSNEGNTPLMEACISDSVDVAELLLTKKTVFETIDQTNEQGMNAIMFAVQMKSAPMVELLLQTARPKLNVRFPNGDSLLNRASQLGSWEVVNLFLKEKEITEQLSSKEITILFLAALNAGEKETLTILLQNTKLLSKLTPKNVHTVLATALKTRHEEVFAVLLQNTEVQNLINNETNYESSLVMATATHGTLPIIQTMMHAGINFAVKYKDGKGKTPLMMAAQYNQDPKVLQSLLLQKEVMAQINDKNDRGMTAILYASTSPNNYPVIKVLLSAGANPLDTNAAGQTALQNAIDDNQWAVVELLMQQKGVPESLHQKMKDGLTLLEYAIKREKFDIFLSMNEAQMIAFILDNRTVMKPLQKLNLVPIPSTSRMSVLQKILQDADNLKNINSQDQYGYTALMVSVSRGYLNEVKVLLALNPDLTAVTPKGRNLLQLALDSKKEDVVALILSTKESRTLIDQPNNNGETPLMVAVKLGLFDSVKRLLDAGANLHIKERQERTSVLGKAIELGNLPMVSLLLSQKSIASSPWILSEALNMAAQEGQTAIVKYILEKHTVPLIPDYEGYTVLDYARYGGNANTVQLIIKHYGEESAQRKRDPELGLYLDRARLIKNVSHALGLNTNIKLRLPNSTNSIFLEPLSNLTANSVSFLVEMIDQYGKTKLEPKTARYFKNIKKVFANELAYLQKDGSMTEQDLIELYKKNEMVSDAAGWYQHDLTMVYYKKQVGICNKGPGMFNTGTQIFDLQEDLSPEYLAKIKSVKMADKEWDMLPKITGVFNSGKPRVTFPSGGAKWGNCSFTNAKGSIEIMLFHYILEDYLADLNSKDEAKIKALNAQGITDFASAKKAAIAEARREYKVFTKAVRDLIIQFLIKTYQDKNTLSADKDIARDLLAANLKIHHGQTHPLAKRLRTEKMRGELNRAKMILNALSKEDRLTILESLSNDHIDLYAVFFDHKDKEALSLLSDSRPTLALALNNAVQSDNIPLVEHLMNSDFRRHVNDPNDAGYTPLALAVSKGLLNTAKKLIEAGADPTVDNRKTGENLSAMASSCGAQSEKMLELLVSARKAWQKERKSKIELSSRKP